MREIRFGLLEAAVERMRDTAPHAESAQPGEHAILRLAHVAQHGQVEFARELQLPLVEELLPVFVGFGTK